jgi:hypothetical protein
MAKPENVRIERPDGTTIPCELIHRGYNTADDIDEWDAVTEVPYRHGIDQLHVEIWPAHTSIGFRIDQDST